MFTSDPVLDRKGEAGLAGQLVSKPPPYLTKWEQGQPVLRTLSAYMIIDYLLQDTWIIYPLEVYVFIISRVGWIDLLFCYLTA